MLPPPRVVRTASIQIAMFWKTKHRSEKRRQSHSGPHRGQNHVQQQKGSHQPQSEAKSANPTEPAIRGNRSVAKQTEMDRLANDADIAAEAATKFHLQNGQESLNMSESHKPGFDNVRSLPLNVRNHSHSASRQTAQLVAAAGGLPMLRRFTSMFYEKAFLDPHLDQFIRDHSDPHGERFASWIAEKMGLGQPWSTERATRQCPFHLGHGMGSILVHDRSSAHFAAWHSPKREPDKWGEHFHLDDCRLWMRLHFWAARESGAFENEAFADYYVRFSGHFVSVYERQAPPFARESARWSADPEQLKAYLDAGRRMPGIMGLDTRRALSQLPSDERLYASSDTYPPTWPYELR